MKKGYLSGTMSQLDTLMLQKTQIEDKDLSIVIPHTIPGRTELDELFQNGSITQEVYYVEWMKLRTLHIATKTDCMFLPEDWKTKECIYDVIIAKTFKIPIYNYEMNRFDSSIKFNLEIDGRPA